MQRVIIYIRKSTESEDRQIQSLQAQRDWCMDYVEQNSLTLVDIIQESKSAKAPGREGFNRMMIMFSENKADIIVTWQLNRLSRNSIDEGTLKWFSQQNIIKAIHSTDGISDGTNILLMSVHFGMASQYIVDLRKNVKRGMNQKIEKGVFPGHAPLGYLNNRLEKTIEIDLERKKHIKRIFEMRAEGMTTRLITSQINNEGLTTKRGTNISLKTIEDIIKNPFYYGCFRWNGSLYEGTHDPIISKKLFDLANNDSRGSYNTKNDTSYLKGQITHFESGKTLCCSLIKGKYIYHHLHGDDGKLWINENQIFSDFEVLLPRYIFPKNIQDEIIGKLKENIEIEENKYEENIKRINRIIGKKRGSLKKHTLMRSNEEIDAELFSEIKTDLLSDIQNLKDELNELEYINSELGDSFSDFVELLRNLADKWKQYDNSKKGYWLSKLSVELFYDNKKRLIVEENDLFKSLRNDALNNWSGGPGLNWHTQGLKP